MSRMRSCDLCVVACSSDGHFQQFLKKVIPYGLPFSKRLIVLMQYMTPSPNFPIPFPWKPGMPRFVIKKVPEAAIMHLMCSIVGAGPL